MNAVMPLPGAHHVHAEAMLHLIWARRDLIDLSQRIISDTAACTADDVVKVLMEVTPQVRASLAYPMGWDADRAIQRALVRLLHFMAQAPQMRPADHFYHANLGALDIARIMLRDIEGEDAR